MNMNMDIIIFLFTISSILVIICVWLFILYLSMRRKNLRVIELNTQNLARNAKLTRDISNKESELQRIETKVRHEHEYLESIVESINHWKENGEKEAKKYYQ